MSKSISTEIAVIGAGSIGLSVAYYLVKDQRFRNVILIDPLDPMSLTSAQSGENYRNWWPHPVMTAFTNDGIDLLENIAAETDNRINMTRRGYSLVARNSIPEDLIKDLYHRYGQEGQHLIRIHEAGGNHSSYVAPVSAAWETAPTGVDVILDQDLIRRTFPTYAHDVSAILHVRRAGSISGQQLGMTMLDTIRAAGGQVVRGKVKAIEGASPFNLTVETADGRIDVVAERVVNAAGPMFKEVGAMLGEDIPVSCVYQQKIAFEDRYGAIPRNMPFTIDLDGQQLFWTDEEREILAEDPVTAKLLEPMVGGIHCRPDGAENGKWVKMGWAYNTRATDPNAEEPVDAQFPDSVLRAGSRLHPALKTYIGRLPRGSHHYGGYYTMTEENLPLIGPMKTKGAFMAGALSGFGTMAATITGSICAAWVGGTELPAYAHALSASRYEDKEFMAELTALNSTGVL